MANSESKTIEIGKQLVDFCNQGKNEEAIKTLYSDQIVSVEPCDMPDSPATQKGIEDVIAKNKWWVENHEVHSSTCTGPYPHGDQFIVIIKADITVKAGEMAGQQMQIEEAGLYTVADGKIVEEQFFYGMGG
jgi:ketosteroid isomerase-like protein